MAVSVKYDPEPWWQVGAKTLLRQTVQHLTSKPVLERPALINAMLRNCDHAEWDHVPMAERMKRSDPQTFATLLGFTRWLNER